MVFADLVENRVKCLNLLDNALLKPPLKKGGELGRNLWMELMRPPLTFSIHRLSSGCNQFVLRSGFTPISGTTEISYIPRA